MRIPIGEPGHETSHLEITVTRPEAARGAVPSILYLHGFGSSQSGEKADFFRTRATAAGFSIWSLDFQGHGASGGGMRDLCLSRNLADIALAHRVMAEQGERRVILLGSSMGGLSGLWYSARHPLDVAAGLYIAPAVGIEKAFLRWSGEDGLARWEREGVFEVANELGTWDLGWGFVEDLRAHPNEALAEELSTPSLLLQGKLDDQVAWEDVRELADRCQGVGVEMRLFEDGDHRLVDRKELLWELMLGFLQARGIVD